MHDHVAILRARLGPLMLAASVAGLIGCAPPLVLSSAPKAGPLPPTDTVATALERATVQVRYFSFSPTISIVAWSPTEAGYGLRAWIRRDGSLIRDHRLYVSTYSDPALRAFSRAVVPPSVLLMTGISPDVYACYFSRRCSPSETFGARIPDEVLRAHRDSLVVTFYGGGGREFMITVRRDLIDAYLAAVDAISAELRSRSSRGRPLSRGAT